jgi:ankyrin repeat protein
MKMDFFWKAKLNSLSQKDWKERNIRFSDLCLEESQLLALCEALPQADIGPSRGTGLARFCELLLVGGCGQNVVRMLGKGCLAYNEDFKTSTGIKYSLFHLACACGDTSLMKYLKELKRTGNKEMWLEQDSYGYTPKDIDSKKKINLPMLPPTGSDIIKLAQDPSCFYPFIRRIQMFNVNVKAVFNEEEDTLVHIVVRGGASFLPHLLILLGHWNVQSDKPNRKGLTPLCIAAQNGSDGLAEVLICLFGANPNYCNSKDGGRSPLHYAAESGSCQVTEVLLRREADPSKEILEEGVSLTPEDLAWKGKHPEVAQRISLTCTERADRLTEKIKQGTLNLADLFLSDYSSSNSDKKSLLMVAVEHDQPRLVKALINRSSKDFRNCESQQTVVAIACQNNHCSCLKILLENGCSSHLVIKDREGKYPIDYAAEHGCVECVACIIERPEGLVGLNKLAGKEANVPNQVKPLLVQGRNRRQKEVVTPVLFKVAKNGRLNKIDKIYEDGDDIGPRNMQTAETPLAVAIKYGNIDVVRWLEEKGANIELDGNPRDNFNNCLHMAALSGSVVTVLHVLERMEEQLILQGRSPFYMINQRNRTGATALEIAATSGHKDVVKTLVEHQASTCVPDSTGQLLTCPPYEGIHYDLEQMRSAHMQTVIHHIRTGIVAQVKSVFQTPYDHNLRTLQGETMLMIASAHSTPPVLEYLLHTLMDKNLEREHASVILSRSPADGKGVLFCYIRERDSEKGRAAIHYAIVHNRRENLKLLLRFDPTCVDLVDNEGNSPTHLAAMLHNKKIIKILMDHDAPMNIVNRKQQYCDQVMTGNGSLRRSMEEKRRWQCSASATMSMPQVPAFRINPLSVP